MPLCSFLFHFVNKCDCNNVINVYLLTYLLLPQKFASSWVRAKLETMTDILPIFSVFYTGETDRELVSFFSYLSRRLFEKKQ